MLAGRIATEPDFEILSPPMLSLFAFRFAPAGAEDLDALNTALLEAINDDGRIYLTRTALDGQVAIRFQIGQFDVTEEDVNEAYRVIVSVARGMTA